jgi:two-component system, response regulator RegA
MNTTVEPFLVVDDDEVFCKVMQRALVRRGYQAITCCTIAEAEAASSEYFFNKAIVDLKIAQESGLMLIRVLKNINPAMAIIMLTGYSSVSTAVEAIKLGALNYFPKPIDIDEILKAFGGVPVQHEETAVKIARGIFPLLHAHWVCTGARCNGNYKNAPIVNRAYFLG